MAVSYPDRSMQRMDVLSSFRWSAIFAGLVAALGAQLFLSTIGAALGISATAIAENEGAARGLGIVTGIWMIASPLISMFIGGMVATWLARPAERSVALMHGALVWCLSLVVGAFLVGTMATSALGGLVGSVGNAAGGLAAGATDPAAREQLQQQFQEQRAESGAAIESQVKEAADTAANVGTGVAWASVFAMALSFGAALLGSQTAYKKAHEPIGRDLRPERTREAVVTTKPPEVTRPIVTPTGKDIRPGDEYRPDLH